MDFERRHTIFHSPMEISVPFHQLLRTLENFAAALKEETAITLKYLHLANAFLLTFTILPVSIIFAHNRTAGNLHYY